MATPTLRDLQSLHIYSAGDRVLVRLSTRATPAQQLAIRTAVRRFLRADVRVLCVVCTEQRVYRERNGIAELLAGPGHAQSPGQLGTANLSCSRIEFEDDDKLLFYDPRIVTQQQAQQVTRHLQDWAGPGVEVIVDWRHLS